MRCVAGYLLVGLASGGWGGGGGADVCGGGGWEPRQYKVVQAAIYAVPTTPPPGLWTNPHQAGVYKEQIYIQRNEVICCSRARDAEKTG